MKTNLANNFEKGYLIHYSNNVRGLLMMRYFRFCTKLICFWCTYYMYL